MTKPRLARLLAAGLLGALGLTTACAPTPEMPADLVLRNGKVVTVDPNVPDGEAIAVLDDTVLAVGSNREIRQYIGSETEVIDVEALQTYTINGAYSAFEEDIKGSLTPGKLADITVLSKDILTIPEEETRPPGWCARSWEGGSCSRRIALDLMRIQRLRRRFRVEESTC